MTTLPPALAGAEIGEFGEIGVLMAFLRSIGAYDRSNGREIYLSAAAGKRIAIGSYDGRPALGFLAKDIDRIMEIEWSAAAFLRGVSERDWLCLSAQDASVKGAVTLEEVPLRLWIPAARGIFDGWFSTDQRASRIDIRRFELRKDKRPLDFLDPVLKSLPLTCR